MDVKQRLAKLIAHYGEGEDGNAPTRAHWLSVLGRQPEAPFALINFFKFRSQANYGSDSEPTVSGNEAFQKYADVSIPSMQAAGGEFLTVADFKGTFLGDDEDWDLVAIGKYPNLNAFMALYENPAYMDAFHHRTAAVARQKVLVIEQ